MNPAPDRISAIDRSLLCRNPEQVALELLGCLLVVGAGEQIVVLRVDEVEAYGGVGEDPGSHAFRGLGRRNATMFERPGSLYVYFTYGMHWCANVVAHPLVPDHGSGSPAGAVLIRAGEVLEGLDLVRSRRTNALQDRDLARGPARLTRGLGLSGTDDGLDLLDPTSRVRLLRGTPPERIDQGPRVGVAGAGAETPWRWWDPTSRHVSAYRAAQPRRPRRSDTSGPA